MRISDWSSDVCSSDLDEGVFQGRRALLALQFARPAGGDHPTRMHEGDTVAARGFRHVMGRDEDGHAALARQPQQILPEHLAGDRKSVVMGKSVSVSLDLGVSGFIKKKNRESTK